MFRCPVCYSDEVMIFECKGDTTNPLEICYGIKEEHKHCSCNNCCHEWVK